jgi:hypothetical protein
LQCFKRAKLSDGFAHPFETTDETLGDFADKPECMVRRRFASEI